MEPFPAIPGVEFRLLPDSSRYAVSSDGRVWSCCTRNGARPSGWYPVSQYRRPYGARYCVVSLRANDGVGKVVCRYVHRLVLEAFVGPPSSGSEQTLHADGDTANNALTNLSWGTVAENVADRVRHGTVLRGERHPMAKLSAEQVAEIRRIGASMRQRDVGALFGVSQSAISSILRGDSWKSIRSLIKHEQL